MSNTLYLIDNYIKQTKYIKKYFVNEVYDKERYEALIKFTKGDWNTWDNTQKDTFAKNYTYDGNSDSFIKKDADENSANLDLTTNVPVPSSAPVLGITNHKKVDSDKKEEKTGKKTIKYKTIYKDKKIEVDTNEEFEDPSTYEKVDYIYGKYGATALTVLKNLK